MNEQEKNVNKFDLDRSDPDEEFEFLRRDIHGFDAIAEVVVLGGMIQWGGVVVVANAMLIYILAQKNKKLCVFFENWKMSSFGALAAHLCSSGKK